MYGIQYCTTKFVLSVTKISLFSLIQIAFRGVGDIRGGGRCGGNQNNPQNQHQGRCSRSPGGEAPLPPPKKSLSVLKEYRHLCYTI